MGYLVYVKLQLKFFRKTVTFHVRRYLFTREMLKYKDLPYLSFLLLVEHKAEHSSFYFYLHTAALVAACHIFHSIYIYVALLYLYLWIMFLINVQEILQTFVRKYWLLIKKFFQRSDISIIDNLSKNKKAINRLPA